MPQQNICYNCFKEKENNGVCSCCGYSSEQDMGRYPLALSHGTILVGRYIIGRVLGQGGFGITYVAQDYQTKQLVAIKEYFPDTLAARNYTRSVSFLSKEREDGFRYGKKCFLDEAKTLAEFIGNPNIVRVYSYFEENNTAYFVMEYIEGISLKTYLDNNGGKISFEEAKRILLPVMDALSAVHSKGIIHRDISPDNIFITKDGTVKLIDFGAARYSLGDRSRSLDIILKHGYAPKEQYTRRGRQGSYTDVYSFAATLYRAITGRVPPDSLERIDEDSLEMPGAFCRDIPPKSEKALIKGLSVMVGDRFQSMAEFKTALIPANKNIPQKIIIKKNDEEEEEKFSEEKSHFKNSILFASAGIGFVVIFCVILALFIFSEPSTTANSVELSYLAGDSSDKSLVNNTDGNSSEKSELSQSITNKNNSSQSIVNKNDSAQSSISKIISSKGSSVSFAQNESDFSTSSYNGGVQITGYSGSDKDVTIPSKINDKSVTAIGDSAFRGQGITSVTIPDGVTSIGRSAFYGCSSLTSITVPDSVTEIGSFAFEFCSSLKKVSLPKNCNVHETAFFGCDNASISRR